MRKKVVILSGAGISKESGIDIHFVMPMVLGIVIKLKM